ncbi:MAG: amphi-Trp domain-containing protein [Candidatus Adiutrix sp.]|jgi:amphi-Trp domain-containing protein|nr:amphi-Trp domain-containing protein [Candidatus Adiutrix sp.]
MKDVFKHQAALDPQDLARLLEILAKGAESGRLPLTEDGRDLTLHLRGLIDLRLLVRRRQGRCRLSLDLVWAEAEEGLPLLSGPRGEPA